MGFMSKLHLSLLLALSTCLTAALPAAEEPAPTPSATPEQQQHIRQAVSSLRNPRTEADRRLRTVKDLLAIGPAGAAAMKDFVDKELQRFGAMVKDPPPTAPYDEKIAELRKVLAGLRKDADLTEEKTKTTGRPALDQLSAVYTQREALVKAHYQKLAKVAVPIEQLVAFLKRWEEKAKDDEGLQSAAIALADYREKAEKLATQAKQPVDEATRSVLEENEKIAQKLPPDEVAGMRALNAMRIMCGLCALKIDVKLCEAGRAHSADMQSRGFFAHESPVEGKKTPFDRAKLAGTTASGENIYMGSNATVEAIKAWFISPGHHKNMLGESHRRQGLGRTGKYWTQMFGD
jgi:uncharacterized protein YkwD